MGQEGKAVASRNLRWSIFAEFLGFVVWQLWSVVVVSLPAAGFQLSTGEIFWLISMPSLVGATLRIPYTFMVPRFGGRNWTIVSAGLLLIPSIGLAIAVSNPATPFGLLLLIAAFAGFGGGNFASSMANITFFYPAAQKGYALGLNAARRQPRRLGRAVRRSDRHHRRRRRHPQPAGRGSRLGAAHHRRDGRRVLPHGQPLQRQGRHHGIPCRTQRAAPVDHGRPLHRYLRLVHRLRRRLPEAPRRHVPRLQGIAIGTATVTLAFLGALIGSLARPYGGKLADRFGGTVITMGAFTVMGLGILGVILTLPMQNFAVFLLCFLVLFAAAGMGNGATYRMIPTIFALRSNNGIGAQRKAAAALGLISAIGAYGGFFIPQLLGFSKTTFGSYTPALGWFALAYVAFLALTAGVYLRMAKKTGTRI